MRSHADILEAVSHEIAYQVARFGIQSLPDGTRQAGDDTNEIQAKIACEIASSCHNVTWRHVLTEEFREALNAADLDKLQEELTQVAAVCVSWIRDIEGRKHGL